MALRTLTLIFATILLPASASAAPIDLEKESKRQLPAAVAAYKGFHRHPEVSRKERETARKLAGYLRELGMEVTEKIGGHGIYADRAGHGDGLLMVTAGLELALTRRFAVMVEYDLWTPVVDDPGDFYAFSDNHMAFVGFVF